MGKIDTQTKEFWKDNEHFADLFNAVIFQGEPVIIPDMLKEKDTDVSATVRSGKKYIDTVSKARDVVKKAALGMEFAVLAIENQTKVDYTMPVRTMLYDSLGYWRECRLISNKNVQKGKDMTTAELFSIGKEDRLHPITTIILYYGEEPWDGPKSLHEMLIPAPERIRTMTPDYPLNLIEIRNSEDLIFHNPDVKTVFSLVRKIYRKEIDDKEFCHVRKDLAEVVGTIVRSEKIVKLAKKSKKEEINMCRALEELMQEREMKGKLEGERAGELKGIRKGMRKGIRKGRKEGELAGIRRGKVEAYYDAGFSAEKIAEKMELSIAEVRQVLDKAAVL